MFKMFKKYWQNKFWRNNAIYLGGSLSVAFLNYLYHPILGRLLSVDEFGELQALLAILSLFGMVLAGFQIVSVNIVVNDKKHGKDIIHQFEIIVLTISFIIMTMFAVLAPVIQKFFGFSSPVPFVVLSASMILSVPYIFRRAYLQSNYDFTSVSASGIINSLFKLIISVVLVVFGAKTLGAIGGVFIAQLLGLIYVYRKARIHGLDTPIFSRLVRSKLKTLKPHLKYLLYVSIVFLFITLLYSADILFMKRFFDPTTAGLYAGISAISKIVFFATASFATVLLSSVSQKFSDKHNKAILRKSLLLVVACGGSILLVFSIIPEFIIKLLLGSDYAEFASYLPRVTFLMFLLSISNLYAHYYLALRRYAVVAIATLSSSLTMFLCVIRNHSVGVIIQNFWLGSALLVLLLAVVLDRYYERQVVCRKIIKN